MQTTNRAPRRAQTEQPAMASIVFQVTPNVSRVLSAAKKRAKDAGMKWWEFCLRAIASYNPKR